MAYQTNNQLEIHVKFPQLRDALYQILHVNNVSFSEEGRMLSFQATTDTTYAFVEALSEMQYRGTVEYVYTIDDGEVVTQVKQTFQDGELIEEAYEYDI
ncbi:MAG: hypothetical protein ACRCZJ_00135 [Erysipelotrichaceae bacterium]